MNKVDISKIEESISAILDEADLKSISAKAVRLKLQEKLNEDFTKDKSEIDKLIMKLYNERLPKSDNEGDNDESSSLDDEINVKAKKRKITTSLKRDNKKKIIASSNDKNGQKVTTSNAAADEGSGADSIVDNDNDAEMARALQAEINGMRNVRKTFTNRKPKENKKVKSDKSASGGAKPTRGYGKDQKLSDQMSQYLGSEKMPRHDVVKKFWDIAKAKNMFDPSNRQFVLCDDDWQRLFSKKRIRMFSIAKFLEKHYIKND